MLSILSLVFWMYVAWDRSVTPPLPYNPALWLHYSVSDRLGVCVKMDSILRVLPRHGTGDDSTVHMWPLSLWCLGWYGGWWWGGGWKLCKGDATTRIHRYQPMAIINHCDYKMLTMLMFQGRRCLSWLSGVCSCLIIITLSWEVIVMIWTRDKRGSYFS